MAKRSATATDTSRVINADLAPDPNNPHSWLVLVGDPSDITGPRLLTGTLRPLYRDAAVSSGAFAKLKLHPVPPPVPESWAPTAYRSEVLLPDGADDRFACPRTLMEAADELATAPTDALLAYATLTWMPQRLHEQYETVRRFVVRTILPLGCPVLLVQHAPLFSRSRSLPHVHLCIVPVRLTHLGWADRVKLLCGDKARAFIRNGFDACLAEPPA